MPGMGMLEFGQLVRKRRDQLGLSSMEVAYSVGQAQSWLSKLENGGLTHPPAPSVLLALSDVLKLPEWDMLRAIGYVLPGRGIDAQATNAENAPPSPSDPLDAAIVERLATLTADEKHHVLSVISFLAERGARPARDPQTREGGMKRSA